MLSNIRSCPNEFDYSPINVKILNTDNELTPDKWYILNIVKFKYLYSFTGLTNGLTKYKFVVVNQRGNEKEKWLKKYDLEKFDRILLDGRADVIAHNKAYEKASKENAEEYSQEFIQKGIDSITIRDFDKVEMLERTKESEDSLNENIVRNIGQ